MSTLRKVLDLLTHRERRQAYLLAPIVVLMALAEVAGIASITPFLALVSDPEVVRSGGVLDWAYQTFGFESDRSFLIAVGVGVVVVLVGANAVLTAGYWILFRFGSIRTHSISRRLLIRYLQQPYAFFLKNNSASLANNILQEVQQVINGIVIPGLQVVAKGVAALAIVILLVTIDPLLALLAAAFLGGAYGVIFALTRRYLRRIGKDRVRMNQARYKAANEAMGGIKDLKLAGREAEMVHRFSVPSRRFAIFQANNRIIGQVPRYALEAVAFGSIVAIVLILMASGSEVAEIVPVLGLYAFAGYRLLPALQAVFSGLTNMRYSSGALDEVHAMLVRRTAHVDVDGFTDRTTLKPLPFERTVRFEGVQFGYGSSAQVLRGIDLEIRARTSVAFVGATGAGKTTLVDVLLGLLEPTGGRIVVDDVLLDGEALARWQMQVGYVPQGIFLTDDTIARNIAFGLPDAEIDMDAVRQAARMAQIDVLIEDEMVDGYETIVGERGVRLSGGQRQRIGIARALYHDPAVLVLDEATSALDGGTERHVFEAIAHLAGRKTIVMIAHRLSTIEACDRVHLLDHGRLVASGTFEELGRRDPAFRAFVQGGRQEEPVAPGSGD